MNILCMGAALCDIAVKPLPADAFEKRRIELDSLDMNGGGDANNASTDLAILGENVRLISRVGDDFIGRHLTDELSKKGVDTRYVLIDPKTQTTAAVLMLGTEGTTVISARHSGACDKLTSLDVTDEALDWADHIHIVNVLNMPDFNGKGLANVFERAKAKNVTTSMDLKRPRKKHERPMDCIEDALKYCDVFLPSNYEIEYLLGDMSIEESRDFFSKYGIKVFGIKRGEEGVYITDFDREIYQKSLFSGTPVDVVGAGDAFSSTFVTSWKRGYALGKCAVIASSASAHVLSAIGATTGMRSFDELVRFATEKGYSI